MNKKPEWVWKVRCELDKYWDSIDFDFLDRCCRPRKKLWAAFGTMCADGEKNSLILALDEYEKNYKSRGKRKRKGQLCLFR